MSYCVKPGCEDPENKTGALICSGCGSKLLLRERYRSIKPLGRGGFGRTFLAVDEDIPSKPRCVVKQFYFIDETSEYYNKAAELFRQEAVRLDDLGKHPQIPYLLAHFEQDKRLYLVQEFIEGQTLEQELEQGAFDESKIWELLQNLVPVLKFIHDRKVIHRDVKLENIIRRTSDKKFVLIDFGIAKLITDSAMQRTGTIIGSQDYIAPEQARGKAVIASDFYSFGVTCLRLLTRASITDLYDVGEQQWWWRHFLPQGKDVSSRLGEFLDKLVQSKVSQRYQSADEVLLAINSKKTAETSIPLSADEVLSATQPTAPLEKIEDRKVNSDKTDLNFSSAISFQGLDYTNLQNLLEGNKWKEADSEAQPALRDRETWKLMCQALSKPIGSHLQSSDIDQFPCADLQIINQLWIKYSQGRYGFSVQKQIYEQVRGDYISFCQRVNWPTYNSSTYYQSLQFSQRAPVGHLPSRIWVAGAGWLRHVDAMAARLEQCNIT